MISFIEFEKKHDCYHSEHIYVLSINKKNSLVDFGFGGLGKRRYNLLDRELFVFNFKDHQFFVWDDNPPETWFKKTGKTQKIELEADDESTLIIHRNYSSWRCWYKNGEFSIYDKHECGYKPSENNSNSTE